MKIAIEAQRIFRTNKHGMDFVILEIIRELQKVDFANEYFIFVKPGEDKCLKETPNFHIIELKCISYPLWEQIALPLAVSKVKADFLHCTSNTAPLFCNVPLILTLHDIIYLEKRTAKNKSIYQDLGFYYRKFVVPRIINKCFKIITVSEYESGRISNHLKLSSDKVLPIYNGFSSHFKPLSNYSDVVRKYTSATDYLFFLGNTDPKKNTSRVLKAYALYLKESNIKRHLLIADISEEAIDEILKSENIQDIKSYIHILGYVNNIDLPAIYNGAFAFLYPSLRESFGIPMLEAMACGTPIIAANTSAMPEIAGSGAQLIDPFNTESIANAILKLENNEMFYKEQKAYGLERVKQFAWSITAQKTLEVYQSLNK